ncbi:MAG: class I SAM-dependent methyltransferase [Oscillatoriales cyanobacterium SM2_2_1]|nr:class I SAM-dependent methyltransferase [Oscillatoriales cyanobacterium SM2_2_1]
MEPYLYTTMAQLEPQHWWFLARRQILCRVIDQLLRPGDRLLDVGCGTGFILEALQTRYDVWGLDSAAIAIEQCQQRGVRQVCQGSFEDLSAQPFDLITFLDVIEHLSDDRQALLIARSHLKDHGKLLITVPAYQFLWSQHDVAHHHYRRYRRSPLRSLLQQTGYHPLHLSYFNTALFPLIAAIRLKQRLHPPATPSTPSDLSLPAPWLNRTLQWIFAQERWLMPHIPLPFGVSLLAIAQKKPPVELPEDAGEP